MNVQQVSDPVSIDFEAASVAWRANKLPTGEGGSFMYRCNAVTHKGPCFRLAVSVISFDHPPLCKIHTRSFIRALPTQRPLDSPPITVKVRECAAP